MPQVTELPLGEGIPLWRWTRRMVCFSQNIVVVTMEIALLYHHSSFLLFWLFLRALYILLESEGKLMKTIESCHYSSLLIFQLVFDAKLGKFSKRPQRPPTPMRGNLQIWTLYHISWNPYGEVFPLLLVKLLLSLISHFWPLTDKFIHTPFV